MFQSGIDVSTLCSLKYGDVSEGLAKNHHPLKLDIYRPKTGVEYYTFLGKDAVEALRVYLKDAESRGIKFTNNTPLFVKERSRGEPMETNLVQNMFREVAVKTGLVDGENNGKDFNPLSPHALRESFGSIMTNNGVPDTIVDFWLGHAIGELAQAYKSVQYQSLKEMYLQRERLISITAPPVDLAEIENKVELKVEERNRQLQTLVNGLTTENLELKSKMAKLELDVTEKAKRLSKVEEAVKELETLKDQVKGILEEAKAGSRNQ
jgi:integrase/recombinase XerD